MRLHLIDGTFELFRAHYSKRPDRLAPNGMDVKATVGVLSSLIGLLEESDEQVTHLAVAFDNPIESFRNALFDGYKTSEGMEPAILAQFDLVEKAVAALGVTVWSMDRYEADDALATAARRWRDQVAQVRILTPDKDLGQCVTGNRVVLVDRIPSPGNRRRWRASQARLVRQQASRIGSRWWGTTADGIPGVPGFGAKTAAALLAEYETVEAIPARSAHWSVKLRGAMRLAATLEGMREEVALYKHLATLAEDVPLSQSLADLRWTGARRSELDRIGRELGGLAMRPSRYQPE